MTLDDTVRDPNDFADSEKLPTFFVGHGNPMNAIEDNEFSRKPADAAKVLPRPRAILCVLAHWETVARK